MKTILLFILLQLSSVFSFNGAFFIPSKLRNHLVKSTDQQQQQLQNAVVSSPPKDYLSSLATNAMEKKANAKKRNAMVNNYLDVIEHPSLAQRILRILSFLQRKVVEGKDMAVRIVLSSLQLCAGILIALVACGVTMVGREYSVASSKRWPE